MKKLLALFIAVGFLSVSSVRAEVYGIDKAHSQVGFSVKHVLSVVHGEFKEYDGTIHFDPKKPEASKIDVTIQTASVSTDNEMRDHHLQSPDFFNAAQFPTITFKSTNVAVAGDNHYTVTGDLTLHGVTKSVVLDVNYLGQDTAMGAEVDGFSATTKIDRRDFGLSWGEDKLTSAGNLMVGNDVNIQLDLTLMTKKAIENMKKMMSKPKPAPASN